MVSLFPAAIRSAAFPVSHRGNDRIRGQHQIDFVAEIKRLLRGTSIRGRRSLLPVLHGSALPVVAGVPRNSTTASADFRPTPAPLTNVGSACRQACVADTCDGSPWIRRMAFSAQAPDLPMRLNTVFSFWGVLRDRWLTCLAAPARAPTRSVGRGLLSVTSQI